MTSEVVEVEGHIIDSFILAKVLDVIVEAGVDYRIVEVDIARIAADRRRPSPLSCSRRAVSGPESTPIAALRIRCRRPTPGTTPHARRAPERYTPPGPRAAGAG